MGGKERHAPPRCHAPAAVSVPVEEERAGNWEERKQKSNWAQGRPTHGSETSPSRTHNNTQGNHEVRVLQQPPNAAHAQQAINKHTHTHTPPLQGAHVLHKGGGYTPAPGGARHRGGNRAMTQPTAHETVHVVRRCEILGHGGAGGWDKRGCAKGSPRGANRQGHRHTEHGSHTRRDKGEHSTQGGGAQQGRRGNQNSGNREPEWRGWESVRMGGSHNKWDGLAASPVATGCQGNPCSTGIRWGVSPAAQMGCLRNRCGSPLGADQP